MACLALASLPGCGGETSQDHNPGASKEPTGTPASTSPSTSPETNGTDLRVKALSYVGFKAPGDWNINRVEPGCLIHNAIGYALNQWPKLIIYCEDGLFNISNAAAKNAIRPLTVGRRNWLFADTPDGARASAIYYSLIESAKDNGLEPFEYICYVLEELPYADTVEKLEALLPWNVKASGALSRNTSHSQTA
nr:transposase [Endozoicomonas acroporae]